MHSSRRRALAGGAALLAGGALWLAARGDRAALAEPSGGLLLLSRADAGLGRQLVAAGHGAERTIEAGERVSYLAAARSPQGDRLALLKRVPRGSMPTDAVAIYRLPDMAHLGEIETQISFQRQPTYALSWAADGAQLAVPYNAAGRTLLYGVAPEGEITLRLVLPHGRLSFHPQDAGRLLHATRETITLARLGERGAEQVGEEIVGEAPAWSPDGAWLAYRRRAPGGAALVIRSEATRAAAELRLPSADALAWSPDSRRLAVLTQSDGDPLGLARYLPPAVAARLGVGRQAPSICIYDTAGGAQTWLPSPASAMQLAELAWAGPDWLLIAAAPARLSRLIDRRGERSRPLPAIDDYAPMVAWLPDSAI